VKCETYVLEEMKWRTVSGLQLGWCEIAVGTAKREVRAR